MQPQDPQEPAPRETDGDHELGHYVIALGVDDICSACLCSLSTRYVDAGSEDELFAWIEREEFDAVVLGPALDEDRSVAIADRLRAEEHEARPIFIASGPSIEFSVAAMRSGAVDLIGMPLQTDEARVALQRAAEEADRVRRHRRRTERLKRICRRLHASRDDAAQQVDVLASDLADAYREIAYQMGHSTLANEYADLVGSELDVESLLRCTLEYILGKTGPTNAAVYLPTGSDDYALGAYVNYDMNKDSADVMLDHLADTLAPGFAEECEIRQFQSAEELAHVVPSASDWIGDQSSVVFACRNEGETLAVAALFRDARDPISEEALVHLEAIRGVFARQLAKVIAVHNRHKPKDAWPGFEIDESGEDEGETYGDDYGLAA